MRVKLVLISTLLAFFGAFNSLASVRAEEKSATTNTIPQPRKRDRHWKPQLIEVVPDLPVHLLQKYKEKMDTIGLPPPDPQLVTFMERLSLGIYKNFKCDATSGQRCSVYFRINPKDGTFTDLKVIRSSGSDANFNACCLEAVKNSSGRCSLGKLQELFPNREQIEIEIGCPKPLKSKRSTDSGF
jgi:hypothetical protein